MSPAELSPVRFDLGRSVPDQWGTPPPGPGSSGFGQDPVLLLLDVGGQRHGAAERAPELLDAGERARAAAFRHAADRDCYRVAHVALRLVLGHLTGAPPSRLPLERLPCPECGRPEGRPALRGDAPHFSLSHTRDWVLLAVAPAPVGVDVEQDPSPEAVRDIQGMLAQEETAALTRLPEGERARAFARAWARKEACGKATGTGLGHGALHRYVGTGVRPAPQRDGLRLLDVTAPPGHAAAVALRQVRDRERARRGVR